MATQMKRITFAITEEMKPLLDHAKKDMFYDRNQSEMIREILMAGLEVMDEKSAKGKECDRAC